MSTIKPRARGESPRRPWRPALCSLFSARNGRCGHLGAHWEPIIVGDPDRLQSMKPRGELAIVLHTHMPYVEGFGTWPFGEEWLWEAIATSYLPLLDVLERAPITLSLTPVLCDQLEAPGAIERCSTFLTEIRPESHRRDIEGFRRDGEVKLVSELERSAAEYAAAAERLRGLPGGLLAALGEHATWTSAATHAVLPLLASDTAISLQVQTGIASHRRRFGEWAGGFWLPECAYAPWLDPLLEEAGVRSTCVELTDRFGLGDERHLRAAGDRRRTRAVADRPGRRWRLCGASDGYPASPAYRNYHRADHPPSPRLAQRRGALRPRRGAGARCRARARLRRPRRRARGRTGECACARSTPSCSGTGGTRASPGSGPWSTRRRGRGSR